MAVKKKAKTAVKKKGTTKKPAAKKAVKALKPAAKKTAVKKAKAKIAAASPRKTGKKARAMTPADKPKPAKKTKGESALTKLERALMTKMIEADELAVDMGLAGAVETTPAKKNGRV